MRNLSGLWSRPIAVGLVLSLAMPLAQASTAVPGAPDGQQQQTSPATATPAQTPSLETRDQSGQPANGQATPDQSQSQSQTGSKPVGTAVAPEPRTTGITASRPAGAVIAPAKQKRARTIIIRIGIVVGAAIAVGVVVGLSKASPSRPSMATASN